MDLAQSRQPFVVPDDSGDEAERATDTSPQGQRKRVNRMLKLMQRKATMYELLDVQVDATNKDILTAWKKTVGGIHPDKNKDKAAKRCTQAANAAKDVLWDLEKRKIYDNFIKNNPPPLIAETFGEDFAESAFDNAGSDDDALEQDDEDSEEDVEANYPPPGKQVIQLHNKITPRIKAFFENVEGAIGFLLLDEIDKINKHIERENHNRKRSVLTMYGVPRQKLLMLQYAQRNIIMGFETQLFNIARVQKEILGLQEYFAKTCQRGLYNWPMDWVQLLMEPLHRKLEMLGVYREEQMPPETDNSTALPASSDGDIEMEDPDEDVDGDVEGTHRQNTVRLLRPGFTVSGDPILGYFPILRRAVGGESVLLGFTMFVKVDSVNPIKIASGSEIGDTAALAYHELPDHKKNNIRERAAEYAIMSPTDFVEIIGVACVFRSASPGRLPTTYIWVKTHTYSDKPTIMTRTTLRQWLGSRVADQRIDSWFVAKGITPESSVSNPASDPRHLRLTYPQAGQSGSYNLRPRMQTDGTQPTPSREDGQIEGLTRKFDQIVDMLVRGQEEAREDRRLQWEMMNRLLPAPHSGA